MSPGERRRLVFTNLANGLPVERVMEAFRLSEAEVMADFEFVCTKVRSYRFERAMPVVPCDSLHAVRMNQPELLHTITKLNLDKDPTFSRIGTLPLERVASGGMQPWQQQMLHMQLRGQKS